MRASETDPLSGVAKSAEPPTPWRDRKPPTGPLSERQRQRLAQERERRGSEGKLPCSTRVICPRNPCAPVPEPTSLSDAQIMVQLAVSCPAMESAVLLTSLLRLRGRFH